MVLVTAIVLAEAVKAGKLGELLGDNTSVVLTGPRTAFTHEGLLQLYLSGITVVDHRWNALNDEDLQALVEALQQEQCRLEDIQLCSNCITESGAAMLASTLATTRFLNCISLYGNRIGANGATVLGEAIGRHPTIATLVLGLNNIQAAGMQGLADGLTQNTSLQSLGLSRNSIGDAGMEALALLLERHPSLTRLELLSNNISAIGSRALGEALAKNSSLTDLLLGENPLGNAGAICLSRALEVNSSLQCLELSKCDIADDGMWALADSMGENESVTRLDISRNFVEDLTGVLGLFSYNKGLASLNMESQAAAPSREVVAFRAHCSALPESSDDLEKTSARLYGCGSLFSDSDDEDWSSEGGSDDEEESQDEEESDVDEGSDEEGRHLKEETSEDWESSAEEESDGSAERATQEHTESDSVTGSDNEREFMDGSEDQEAALEVDEESAGANDTCDEPENSSSEEEPHTLDCSESEEACDESSDVDDEAEYEEAMRLYAEEDRRLREEEQAAPLRAELDFHRSLLENDSDEEVEDLQDRWLGLREAIRRSRDSLQNTFHDLTLGEGSREGGMEAHSSSERGAVSPDGGRDDCHFDLAVADEEAMKNDMPVTYVVQQETTLAEAEGPEQRFSGGPPARPSGSALGEHPLPHSPVLEPPHSS